MLELLIVTQLFGATRETRAVKTQMKYGTTGSSAVAWMFIIWVFLSMFIWPIGPGQKAWKSSPVLGVFFYFIMACLGLFLFPLYGLVGVVWGVATFVNFAKAVDAGKILNELPEELDTTASA